MNFRIGVRWRDRDPLGHVNHAAPLTYLEEGRNSWLSELLAFRDAGRCYVIARCEIDYISEIGCMVQEVSTRVVSVTVGNTSFTTQEQVYEPSSGRVFVKARVVCVMWDGQRHRPRLVSDGERHLLETSGIS